MSLEYSVDDWLDLHDLRYAQARAILTDIKRISSMVRKLPKRTSGRATEYLDFNQALYSFVYPSLNDLLGYEADSSLLVPSEIKFILNRGGEHARPLFRWDDGGEPTIEMSWSGTCEDLICLAHEVTHAVQAKHSEESFMPPVARECCAFIGELALLRFIKRNEVTFHDDASQVWLDESIIYFGDDALDLEHALNSEQASYAYRQNYPIARLYSTLVYPVLSVEQARELFSSGSQAMEILQCFAPSEQRADLVSAARPLPQYDEILRLSLSDGAFQLCQRTKIKRSRLSQTAMVSLVERSEAVVEKRTDAPNWIKWRSLGLFALLALQSNKADVLPGQFLKQSEGHTERSSYKYSVLYPWLEPNSFDVLTALGIAVHQLAGSPYHRQFPLSAYLPVEILPPVEGGQIRCYADTSGSPLGVVTWAWLSNDAVPDVHATGRSLASEEWSSGNNLFFNDWITHKTAFRPAMNEMCNHLFADCIATSLRRNQDGSVRRVNRWIGATALKETAHHERTIETT